MVVHACNSSYLVGRSRQIVIQGHSGQKLVRSNLQKLVGTYSQLGGRPVAGKKHDILSKK
jgi:hypothetical protein